MDTEKSNVKLNVNLAGGTRSHQSSKLIVSSVDDGVHATQTLEISFKRTVRVSDNGETDALPPSLGSFPIYSTEKYASKLPTYMAGKKGFFIPMYQREAMWMNTSSTQPFIIKIYVGGVNAVSGEPARETTTTAMRRLKLMEAKKNIQDYLVTPKQLWLDGIASSDGTVRQFVAMPLGKGYSVEAQVTGEELIGGLQFEITPSKLLPKPKPFKFNPSNFTVKEKPAGTPHYDVVIKTLRGKSIDLSVSDLHTINEVKLLVEEIEGIPPDQQQLIYSGEDKTGEKTLGECSIKAGAILHLVLCLRGGGSVEKDGEMGVAAGGLIRQTIIKDMYDPSIWESNRGIIFNVQVLNSERFHEVTGVNPPPTPVTAEAYAKHGYPYYGMFEEKLSGVQGEFAGVKSVNEMDIEGKPSMEKAKAVAEVIKSTNHPVVLLDEKGQRVGFRTRCDLEKAVRERFAGMGI